MKEGFVFSSAFSFVLIKMDGQTLFIVSLKDIFSLVTLLLLSICSLYCLCALFFLLCSKQQEVVLLVFTRCRCQLPFLPNSILWETALGVNVNYIFNSCHNRDAEIDVAVNI